jgi:hypothetical protein
MPPTHRENVLKRLGLPKSESLSIAELSARSKIPKPALQAVYNRGIGAHGSNLASVRLLKDFSKNPNTSKFPASARLSKEQWAMARVYSFVDKGTTYKTTDSDIVKKYSL